MSFACKSCCHCGSAQHLLYHQRVDVDHTHLQQVQRQQRNFLVCSIVAGNFTALAIENITIAANPYDIKLFLATLRAVAASLPSPLILKSMLGSPLLKFLPLVTLCLSLTVPTQAMAQAFNATVVSTGDGDTLRVNQNGQTVTLRLACLDAAESDQPGGQAAADRLSLRDEA